MSFAEKAHLILQSNDQLENPVVQEDSIYGHSSVFNPLLSMSAVQEIVSYFYFWFMDIWEVNSLNLPWTRTGPIPLPLPALALSFILPGENGREMTNDKG